MIRCDGLTGTILAAEGISDACTLLNGPIGCKCYHGHLSDVQYTRSIPADPLSFNEKYYFGQARVPCTYLDERDYIDGAGYKLMEVLRTLSAKAKGPLIIVNSPGASLIGDDIGRMIRDLGLDGKCMFIEEPGPSMPSSGCYDRAIVHILEWFDPEFVGPVEGTVNILGISLLQRYWQGAVDELTRLLVPMGLTVSSAIGAGSDSVQLRGSVNAVANIPVCSEYCGATSNWYESNYGVRTVGCPRGAPVGFDATEEWIKNVAAATGRDPAPSLKLIASSRKMAYSAISKFNASTGLPRGATFSVRADSSIALPLVKWLYEYLGMVPSAVEITEGRDEKMCSALREQMGEWGFGDALNGSVEGSRADIILAEGRTVELLTASKLCQGGVDIAIPAGTSIDLVPRTIFGASGSLYLIERILNGLRGSD